MANYREIVTKAVIAKGKKLFTTNNTVKVDKNPSTILGCWVINHNFNGVKSGDNISINGSYDVNIWYSYDNDTKTEVIKETNNYNEVVHLRERDEETSGEEIIVRSLKQPSFYKRGRKYIKKHSGRVFFYEGFMSFCRDLGTTDDPYIA